MGRDQKFQGNGCECCWHYTYASAGKRTEPKNRVGHVCTDESSVYGLDKGVTGTECKWH